MDHFAAAAGTPSPREEREAGDLSLSAVRGYLPALRDHLLVLRASTSRATRCGTPRAIPATDARTRRDAIARDERVLPRAHRRVPRTELLVDRIDALVERIDTASASAIERRQTSCTPRCSRSYKASGRAAVSARAAPPTTSAARRCGSGPRRPSVPDHPPAQTLAVLKRRHPRSATRFGAQLGQHPGVDLVGLDTSGATSWTLRA
jgi:hypothetical protein